MLFEIKGLNQLGRVRLKIEADDARQAAERARAEGITVLGVSAGGRLADWVSRRRAHFPLVLFSRELLALLSSGLNLIEALQTLTEKEGRGDSRAVLEQVLARLYQGESFSAAITHHPQAFPALYVATVRASERTGNLAEALARYIAYQDQLETVRRKAVASAVYPLVLIVVGSLVTLFLLGYVVPRFSVIYENNVERLPLASRVLMAWGQVVEAHAATAGLAFLAGLAVLAYALAQPAVRAWVLRQIWRIPKVGEQLRVFQLTRFYRTVGMLLSGGIPVVTALQMAEGLLQPELQARLRRAAERIREGKSLSQAMEVNGLTTPVSLRMLQVGEKSGRMGEMMESIAVFHDEETSRFVDWFTRLLEPALMALIGLLIGLIVVLLYMPIFELAGSLE